MPGKTLRDRLMRAIEKSRLGPAELHRISGVPAETIRGWIVNGRNPQAANAEKVLRALEEKPVFPLTGQSLPGIVRPIGPADDLAATIAAAPVLGTVAAAENGTRGVAMLVEAPAGTRFFKLEVIDTSMEPLAIPGQRLVIDSLEPARAGDLVVADLSDDDEPEWVFKRYVVRDRARWLESVAENVPPMRLAGQPRKMYRVWGMLF